VSPSNIQGNRIIESIKADKPDPQKGKLWNPAASRRIDGVLSEHIGVLPGASYQISVQLTKLPLSNNIIRILKVYLSGYKV
jgi:hypothetical protein